MPSLQIPDKFLPFLEIPKRFKIAYGGRGAAKSETFSRLLLMFAQTEESKAVCLRELQNSIEDSVHSLLSSGISDMELQGFDVTDKAIRYNGEDAFKFKGLSRNPDAVKSIHKFKRAWVEEAQAISDKSLKILTPTIRTEGSELWFSMNPGSSEDPMSKRFLNPFMDELTKHGYYEDDLHLIVKVNYFDNPWFPKELDDERRWDKNNLPRSEYDWIWLGEFNDSIDNSLIRAEVFDACIDAHIKLGFVPRGAKYASHDPADLGGDRKGYAMRHGTVVMDVIGSTQGDVNEGCRWATGLANQQQVNHFAFDGDGIGAALREQVAKAFAGTHTQVSMFKGSESPDAPESLYYSTDKHAISGGARVKDSVRNKRAQYYMALRDRMQRTYRAVEYGEYADPDTLLSLSSEIHDMALLRAEVCRMPIKPNGSGKVELYTKDAMKRLFRMRSPDLADTLMMLMRTPPSVATPAVMPRAMATMGDGRR